MVCSFGAKLCEKETHKNIHFKYKNEQQARHGTVKEEATFCVWRVECEEGENDNRMMWMVGFVDGVEGAFLRRFGYARPEGDFKDFLNEPSLTLGFIL